LDGSISLANWFPPLHHWYKGEPPVDEHQQRKNNHVDSA
jgi:hypothetical protein